MTKAEIETFIERMEEIGDVWEEADVERVYGDRSLEDHLQFYHIRTQNKINLGILPGVSLKKKTGGSFHESN